MRIARFNETGISHPGRGRNRRKVIANRCLAVFAIGMTTFLGIRRRQAEADRAEAEEKVREHLADLARMGRLHTAGQLATGWLSDHTGRKPLITAGMLIQAGALGLLVAGGGAFAASLVAALLLGLGTALVYPTLIAAVSDAIQPRERARTVGVYRFWRDFGFVAGALIAGFAADATSPKAAIATVAALTAASGFIVAATTWPSLPVLKPAPVR